MEENFKRYIIIETASGDKIRIEEGEKFTITDIREKYDYQARTIYSGVSVKSLNVEVGNDTFNYTKLEDFGITLELHGDNCENKLYEGRD